MNVTQSIPPVLPAVRRTAVRRGVLLAIAVCLLFHFLLFSGYLDFVERRFNSGEIFFVISVSIQTVFVFCILYRTPVFAQKPGRGAGVGRVAGLVVLAHGFVFGVMLAVAIFWFLVCAILGIPPRDI